MKNSKHIKLLLVLISANFILACGEIPKAYRGEFVDSATQSKLILAASEGTLIPFNSSPISSKASGLEVNELIKGVAGIYVSTKPVFDNKLEVYWIRPNLASKQASNNFVWMNVELAYTQFDSNKKTAVQNITMYHCAEGSLMIDTEQMTFQAGCPENNTKFNFVRTK